MARMEGTAEAVDCGSDEELIVNADRRSEKKIVGWMEEDNWLYTIWEVVFGAFDAAYSMPWCLVYITSIGRDYRENTTRIRP
jgi:hypothetical protein